MRLTIAAPDCIQSAMLRRLLALSVGFSTLAQAQSISGRVTDRVSGIPVAGVVVSALDSSGVPLARSVTDSASGYRITVTPGMTRLNFRRIGYLPADVALRDTVAGRIDVTLSRLPVQLPPVTSTILAQCDAKANQPEVLSLWEETRSGMLTSIVARESKAGYTSVLAYQMGFKGDDELPRVVERIELPPGVSHPFGTGAEPAMLQKTGYLVREGFAEVFIAPDDRVLFDETFRTSHCFTIDEPRTSAPAAPDSLIGIRFSSGKGSKIVGVEGTVWLRRDPLDLVLVEYEYTNISKAMQRVHPGGSIRFRRMPNGITMIAEWRIRGAFEETSRTPMRVPFGRAANRGFPQRQVRGGTARSTSATASELGAVIEMMQWPDAPPYVASLATVSGVLLDRYSKKPLPNTPIRFYNTPFVTTTDSTGAFNFLDVLPGMYQLEAGDFELEKYGAAGDLSPPIAIRYGANSGLRIDGEGAEAAVVRGCGEKVDGRVNLPKPISGPTAIFGVVTTDRGGIPPRDQQFFVEVVPAGAVPGTVAFPLKGKTDEAGRFRVCGVPAGTVRIRATTRSGLVGVAELKTDPSRPYQLVTIKLPMTTER